MQQLDESVTEIYKDRLIAQNLLFKISNSINQQKILTLAQPSDSVGRLFQLNISEMEGYIEGYEKTKLTKKEDSVFLALKEKTEALKELESNPSFLRQENAVKLLSGHLSDISGYLSQLSDIQIKQGEIINTGAHKTIIYSGILNDLDWMLIVITSILILAAIFVSKSIIARLPQKGQLN